MNLHVLPGSFSVCRLSSRDAVPEWAWRDKTLLSATYTSDELSVVCPSSSVPSGVRCESGWVAIKVAGPLDFSLTGVLAGLASPLAEAGVAVFVFSTFDTDYLLVKEERLAQAKEALERSGHRFE